MFLFCYRWNRAPLSSFLEALQPLRPLERKYLNSSRKPRCPHCHAKGIFGGDERGGLGMVPNDKGDVAMNCIVSINDLIRDKRCFLRVRLEKQLWEEWAPWEMDRKAKWVTLVWMRVVYGEIQVFAESDIRLHTWNSTWGWAGVWVKGEMQSERRHHAINWFPFFIYLHIYRAWLTGFPFMYSIILW